MQPPLHLLLFGTPRITRQKRPVEGFVSNKTRGLLIYLAVTRRAHSREALSELLWAAKPDTKRKNLKKALSNLRKLDGIPLVEEGLQTVALDVDRCRVDVLDFERLTAGDVADFEALQRAAQLYQADFLAGFNASLSYEFEAWVLSEQTRLKSQAMEVLRRLTNEYAQRHELARAIATVRRLLQLEPWREEAHRRLMELLVRNGDRSGALVQYEQCRRILAKELDVEPTASTSALMMSIRNGDHACAEGGEPGKILTLPGPAGSSKQDLLEMPDPGLFYGRENELSQLTQWIVSSGCCMSMILGVGGVGKTSLAAKFTSSLLHPKEEDGGDLDQPFEKILWRSLINAPPLSEILQQSIQFFSDQSILDFSSSLDEQFRCLTQLFQQQRCLLILDNVESLMQVGQRNGMYRDGYEGYGQFFQRLAHSRHKSCLLLTGRERPQGFGRLERDIPNVCSLTLRGLSEAAARSVLVEQGLGCGESHLSPLIQRYSGHPLALKLVAETIDDLYFGDVEAFLSVESLIFADIRDVLDQHFARLSSLELEIMNWLAIIREPVSPEKLRGYLLGPTIQRNFLESLRALQRRSLLEKQGWGLTLQNVVLEYTTERLIDRLSAELSARELELFNRYALVLTQAPNHVRESQVRVILQPLIERMSSAPERTDLETFLLALPERLRIRKREGYAAGNIINISRHVDIRLSNWDFSDLSVWQANLQRSDLQDTDFRQARLKDVVFMDAFGQVTSVDISPSGRLVAFGTADGDVRIVNRRDGQSLYRWKGHRTRVNTVGFCPGGKLLASTGSDQTINVWNVKTGQHLATLWGHKLPVTSAHFSPDGNTLVSSSRDGTIRLWDVNGITCGNEGEMLLDTRADEAAVTAVRFSPDGQAIASSNTANGVSLWEVAAGCVRRTFNLPHADRHAFQLRFTPNGKLLAGNNGSAVCLWDVESGQIVRRLTPNDTTFTIDFSPDGEWLFTAGEDGRIRKWHVESGEVLQTLRGHSQRIHFVRVSSDGELLVSGGWDQSVRLWRARSGNLMQVWRGYSNRIWSICFDTSGNCLACGNERNQILVWDVNSGSILHTLEGHTDWVMAVRFSPDGSFLVSGSGDQTIRLWDVASGQCLQLLHGHTSQVRALCFSPDGRLLLSGSGDRTIRLWNVEKREGSLRIQPRQIMEAHEGAVWAACCDVTGRLAASSGGDQTVRLWDVGESCMGLCHRTLRGHEGGVGTLSFSPVEPILASGSGDQTIRLWDISDLENGNKERAIATLHGHADWVNSICFSPKGDLLASGGADHEIGLWEVASGRRLLRITGHTDRVWSVCFSRDGRVLASGSADGTIKFWESETGACLKTLRADRPYERMNITGATGITTSQKAILKTLGAVEVSDEPVESVAHTGF